METIMPTGNSRIVLHNIPEGTKFADLAKYPMRGDAFATRYFDFSQPYITIESTIESIPPRQHCCSCVYGNRSQSSRMTRKRRRDTME